MKNPKETFYTYIYIYNYIYICEFFASILTHKVLLTISRWLSRIMQFFDIIAKLILVTKFIKEFILIKHTLLFKK